MEHLKIWEENAAHHRQLNAVDPGVADQYLRNLIYTTSVPSSLCRSIFQLNNLKWMELRHGINYDEVGASDDCKSFILKLVTTLRECNDHGTVVTFSGYKTLKEIMKDFNKGRKLIDKKKFRDVMEGIFSGKMLFECSTCTPNISEKKIREIFPLSEIANMYVVKVGRTIWISRCIGII